MQYTELEILRLISVVGQGSLLTSEVARIEAAKNLAEYDCKEIDRVGDSKFRSLVNEMIHVQLPDVSVSELYHKAFERHAETIKAVTSGGRWKCLDISNIDLMNVFAQYGRKEGLFSCQTKKRQFADAIMLEQIKHAAKPCMPICIYSRDKDFEIVGKETDNVEYAASLPDLFELLGMEGNASETRGMIYGLKALAISDIQEKLDTFCQCEIDAGESEPRKFGRIGTVEVKQVASIRSDNQVAVSGRISIEAELSKACVSNKCPIVHSRGWKIMQSEKGVCSPNSVDAVFEIDVAAFMHDEESEGLDGGGGETSLRGDLVAENEAGMFWIMQAEWHGTEQPKLDSMAKSED